MVIKETCIVFYIPIICFYVIIQSHTKYIVFVVLALSGEADVQKIEMSHVLLMAMLYIILMMVMLLGDVDNIHCSLYYLEALWGYVGHL